MNRISNAPKREWRSAVPHAAKAHFSGNESPQRRRYLRSIEQEALTSRQTIDHGPGDSSQQTLDWRTPGDGSEDQAA
jgi:hypothetical protein